MERLDFPNRGKRVILAGNEIDGPMSEFGLAVRAWRIRDGQHMVPGPNHRAITLSARECRNGNAINQNAQTEFVGITAR